MNPTEELLLLISELREHPNWKRSASSEYEGIYLATEKEAEELFNSIRKKFGIKLFPCNDETRMNGWASVDQEVFRLIDRGRARCAMDLDGKIEFLPMTDAVAIYTRDSKINRFVMEYVNQK